MLTFRPFTLQALTPIERSRLLALTLPPRHPGEQSVFAQMLHAKQLYVSTLAIVAVMPSEKPDLPAIAGEPDKRWVGWTLAWWRPEESLAHVGVFVDRDHRDQRIGSELLRRMSYAFAAFDMKLRGYATDDAAARMFGRFGIVNDARPNP